MPFPPGARVTVVVIKETQDVFDKLWQAAESSLDFWDNPLDDKDWNDAKQAEVGSGYSAH